MIHTGDVYLRSHKNREKFVKTLISKPGQKVVLGLSIKSGLHMAFLSWQTRVGKLRKVDKLFPSHVKLVSNNKHGNLPHGRF